MAFFAVTQSSFTSSLSSSSCLGSEAFHKVVASPTLNLKRRGLKIAMAPAKFKGTHEKENKLKEMIEKKILEAKKVCEGDSASDECKVAWDEVEEVSQAKADLRMKLEKEDPLESYCSENPETDECRIYED